MAPSIRATPSGRPIAWTPKSATAPIVSGIATPSSLPDDGPGAQPDRAIELQPGAEERDHDRQLAHGFQQLGVLDRMQPGHVQEVDHRGGADAEPEVDEAGGERALVLVRESRHGGEERQPEEEQRDRVWIPRGEAGLGCERL